MFVLVPQLNKGYAKAEVFIYLFDDHIGVHSLCELIDFMKACFFRLCEFFFPLVFALHFFEWCHFKN